MSLIPPEYTPNCEEAKLPDRAHFEEVGQPDQTPRSTNVISGTGAIRDNCAATVKKTKLIKKDPKSHNHGTIVQ
jgi:hypothetical protein